MHLCRVCSVSVYMLVRSSSLIADLLLQQDENKECVCLRGKERGKYREGGRASHRLRERFWISCYVTFFMSGETEAEITEAQSSSFPPEVDTMVSDNLGFLLLFLFLLGSFDLLCLLLLYVCVCLSVCVLCSSCKLVSRVSTWMLKTQFL